MKNLTLAIGLIFIVPVSLADFALSLAIDRLTKPQSRRLKSNASA
jgi:hypothetical protein